MYSQYSQYLNKRILRIGLLILLVLSTLDGAITYSHAKPASHGEACRQVTEALMNGNVDLAVSVIDPVPAERPKLHDSMTRLNYALIGFLKGKRPRLERTLQDIDLETHPVSLQIWSFNDEEVYLVGCLLLWKQDDVQLELQLRNSVEEIRSQMKDKLKQSRS
jgi:hypothetical protein